MIAEDLPEPDSVEEPHEFQSRTVDLNFGMYSMFANTSLINSSAGTAHESVSAVRARPRRDEERGRSKHQRTHQRCPN